MIFGLWGEDKSCKTTLSCTFPKPLAHMEFDVGGFDRAKYRFKDDIANGLITSKLYIMPFQFGNFDPTQLTIRPSKIIVGVKELFYQWLADYMLLLQNKEISSIVIDTSTLLWEIICTGYLQEKQEIQTSTEKPRVSLLPIEYREPNIRMRGIIYQAKAHGKHLVMTHHSRDEYGLMPDGKGGVAESRTGKKERSGFGTLGDSADVIVHTYIEEEIVPNSNPPQKRIVPWCEIELAEVLELVGIKIREPTYDMIANTIKMMRGEG